MGLGRDTPVKVITVCQDIADSLDEGVGINAFKVIDAPIQVPNVFHLAVSFKFLNFISQICPLFVPEMSANFTSYTVQIIYITLAWILYPLHFSLLPLIQKT